MYLAFLIAHSWVRWLVVVAAAAAVGISLWGWLRRRPWGVWADRLSLIFLMAMDLQLLLGLSLYLAFSPLTTSALRNFGAAMGDTIARYWAAEHISFMLLGIIMAHVGRILAKREGEDMRKYRRSAIFYGIAILLVLAAMPWPFLSYGRPLFRL
ncbi:MAG: hypothetical protein RML36_03020 [Anaerolineae bacterium]|nr:hypothetical protein [Anaerolineae bacterium]MDW8098439.1 hypothetical protein [Anaerolineae bacterium]